MNLMPTATLLLVYPVIFPVANLPALSMEAAVHIVTPPLRSCGHSHHSGLMVWLTWCCGRRPHPPVPWSVLPFNLGSVGHRRHLVQMGACKQ